MLHILSYVLRLYLILQLYLVSISLFQTPSTCALQLVVELSSIRSLAADCLIFIIFKPSYFKHISSFYIVVYKALQGFPAIKGFIIYIFLYINGISLPFATLPGSRSTSVPAVTSPKVSSNVLFPAANEAEAFLTAVDKSLTETACLLLHSVTL